MRRQLFDEILVNAVDHKQRDASVTRIDVDIKQGTSSSPPVITVYNDGSGIPVKKHKAEGAPKRLPYKVPIVLTACLTQLFGQAYMSQSSCLGTC